VVTSDADQSISYQGGGKGKAQERGENYLLRREEKGGERGKAKRSPLKKCVSRLSKSPGNSSLIPDISYEDRGVKKKSEESGRVMVSLLKGPYPCSLKKKGPPLDYLENQSLSGRTKEVRRVYSRHHSAATERTRGEVFFRVQWLIARKEWRERVIRGKLRPSELFNPKEKKNTKSPGERVLTTEKHAYNLLPSLL